MCCLLLAAAGSSFVEFASLPKFIFLFHVSQLLSFHFNKYFTSVDDRCDIVCVCV